MWLPCGSMSLFGSFFPILQIKMPEALRPRGSYISPNFFFSKKRSGIHVSKSGNRRRFRRRHGCHIKVDIAPCGCHFETIWKQQKKQKKKQFIRRLELASIPRPGGFYLLRRCALPLYFVWPHVLFTDLLVYRLGRIYSLPVVPKLRPVLLMPNFA